MRELLRHRVSPKAVFTLQATCLQLGTVIKSSRGDTDFEDVQCNRIFFIHKCVNLQENLKIFFGFACPYKIQRNSSLLPHFTHTRSFHCFRLDLLSCSNSQSCSLFPRSLSFPSFLLRLWLSPFPLHSLAPLTRRPSSLVSMVNL